MCDRGEIGLDDVIQAFHRVIPEEVLDRLARNKPARIAEIMVEKKAVGRLIPFFEALNDLVKTVPALPASNAVADLEHSFDELTSHIEGLWDESCLLFRAGRYARALFMAIVSIEELGKAAVGRMQCVFGVPSTQLRKDNSLYNHKKKHYLAACAGAVISSRMDRIIGQELVNSFVKLAESGELEVKRQSALYYEVKGKTSRVPEKEIDRVEAAKFVIIAGELVVELANRSPIEFERQREKVETFENEIGWSELQKEATSRLKLK